MSRLKGVQHVAVGGGRNLVCHWPRQGGIWHWGNEILVAYIESPCEYTDPKQVSHGREGIWKRGYVRLRRSMDGGQTWTDAGKAFDNSLSVEEQRRILHLDEYHGHGGPEREEIDISLPDAILLMGRAWCGSETRNPDGTVFRDNVAYCFRSPDRGRHWEAVPSILWPNHTRTVVELANNYTGLWRKSQFSRQNERSSGNTKHGAAGSVPRGGVWGSDQIAGQLGTESVICRSMAAGEPTQRVEGSSPGAFRLYPTRTLSATV